MTGGETTPIRRYIRHLAGHGEGQDADCELLQRYVVAADQAAFEAIVRRHGPLVQSVCARILGGGPDAEDAFQATFLVLVRKAGSLAAPDSLGPWLYGVACRTALKARAAAVRHQKTERPLTDLATVPTATALAERDLRAVLDELIYRLPQRYRVPFVLCYLEGKTNQEAARIVGCPLGTIFSRLAWARDRLQKQLRRRGLAPASGMFAAWLVESAAPAAVPIASVDSTAHAAIAFAAGRSAAAGAYSGPAAALAEGVLHAMFVTKLKIALLLLATVGIAGVGTFGLIRLATAGEPAGPEFARGLQPPPRQDNAATADQKTLQGTWTVVAVTENGRDVPEAEVKNRNSQFVFVGNKVTIPIRDGMREFAYKLDPTQKPRHIDLVFEGVTSKGLYVLDAGTLKICVAKDGDERPADLAAPRDSNRVLVELKKTR
jgi:RNA polymerase sigma factor (sigma-70 family)